MHRFESAFNRHSTLERTELKTARFASPEKVRALCGLNLHADTDPNTQQRFSQHQTIHLP
ncbi:hypothetical protein RISK_000998 [Rhodopirellula islandica]|uniref:Uncharacterized protein n=1 Tax=Rhodopirellula islandica TaxID=595434 RepID=A0A0J1BL17_RHOIS|nr:hypothetical protein RISK_000998 [Rhodopirellula islandica]